MKPKYYIWQNIYVNSLEISEKEYHTAMNNCIKAKLRKRHNISEDTTYSSMDDTFYDKDDKIVCCLSAITSKI